MSFVRDIPIVGSRSALLIIDVQNYCCSTSKGCFAGKSKTEKYYFERLQKNVIPNIQILQKIFRAKGWEIIYTTIESLTSNGRDRSLDYKLSNLHVPKGDPLANVIEEIAPYPDEIHIPKTSCSVFNSTNINYVLKNLQVTDLVVCGLMTNQCVESAVRDAADLSYRVTLVEDGCAALSDKAHISALQNLKGFSRIKSTTEVTMELKIQLPRSHNNPSAMKSNGIKSQRSQQSVKWAPSTNITPSAISARTPTPKPMSTSTLTPPASEISKQDITPKQSKEDVALKAFKVELQKVSNSTFSDIPEGINNELLRFLIANSLDVTKAKKSYFEYLGWRKQNNVDRILGTQPPCEELIKKCVPYAYYKRDKQGRPVYYERTGKIKCNQLVKEVKLEDFLVHHIWSMEHMHRLCILASNELRKMIDTFVIVLDLEGVDLGHQIAVPFLQACANIDKKYYPGRQAKVLILNAPFVAPALWPVAGTLLDPTTKEGIEILKNKAELLKYISKENLPVEYGGDCTRIFPCDQVVNKKISKEPLRLEKIEITKGNSLVRTLELKKNEVVSWYFSVCDGMDVDFSVHVEDFNGNKFFWQKPTRCITKKGMSPPATLSCEVTFKWDNTFSYWNHKTVELYTYVSEGKVDEKPKGISLQQQQQKLGNKIRPLVLFGPSGVGKQTLMDLIMLEFPTHFSFSVSHTTRTMRKGEKDGVNYHFTTLEKMQTEVEEGKFIESAMVHGQMYGTSKSALDEISKQGKICFLELDVQGIEKVRALKMFSPIYVGIFPPSADTLESRLRNRGSETEETLIRRLKTAKTELKKMEEWKENGLIDIIIINEELNKAHAELKEKLLACYPQLRN